MTKVFKTLVVTSQIAATARALAAALPAGGGMFVAGYSATGAPPATHFVSEGPIEEQFAAALSSPAVLVEMLGAFGQSMTLAQATGLLTQAVVSDHTLAEVAAQMGIVPVSEPV